MCAPSDPTSTVSLVMPDNPPAPPDAAPAIPGGFAERRRSPGLLVGLCLAVIVLVAVAVVAYVQFNGSTAEASPRAEGYSLAGTVDGVDFWINNPPVGAMSVRTTGRLGGICNQGNDFGPAETSTAPVCLSSINGVGTVIAWLVDNDVEGVRAPDEAGETLTATGQVPLSRICPDAKLLVIINPAVVVPAPGLQFILRPASASVPPTVSARVHVPKCALD